METENPSCLQCNTLMSLLSNSFLQPQHPAVHLALRTTSADIENTLDASSNSCNSPYALQFGDSSKHIQHAHKKSPKSKALRCKCLLLSEFNDLNQHSAHDIHQMPGTWPDLTSWTSPLVFPEQRHCSTCVFLEALTMCLAAKTPSTMAQQNAAMTPKLMKTIDATS